MLAAENEAAILELRGLPISAHAGGEGAAAWAVHLAAAEHTDRFAPNARHLFPWPELWRTALADTEWQGATDRLVGAAADARDPFFKSWIDAWLARNVGMRLYGLSLGDAILKHVKARAP